MKPRIPQQGLAVPDQGNPVAAQAAPNLAPETPGIPKSPIPRISRRTGLILLFVASPLVLYACTSTLGISHNLRLSPTFPDEIATAAPGLEEPPAAAAMNADQATPDAPKNGPDLWLRIRAGLRFAPKVENARIAEQIRGYTADPASLRAVQRRAKPYLYFIVGEVEKRRLPMELALLPIVESGFRPLATSPKQAAGIWQFIPNTGLHYGLEENEWHDERRDVVQSTRAALDMLQQLSRSFRGDWELALAAYNAGIGRVWEAQELNRLFDEPTDFWSLELPTETRHYVRRLLAISQLVDRPQAWGVRLEPVPDAPYFASVPLDRPLDLSVAAELAEAPVSELFLLNPGMKRWTAAGAGPQTLNLPVAQASRFRQGLAKIEPAERLRTRSYQVREGDTLERIALKYGADVKELRAANHLTTGQPQPGDTLHIPLSALPLDQMALLERARGSS